MRHVKIVRTARGMQKLALQARGRGIRIGFVPTMGYLHEGHVALMKDARKRIGPQGLLVVSIYVNPTQFGPTEDLSRYPRDFRRDRRLCREAGVDVVFYPQDSEMYPGRSEGLFSTYVTEVALSVGMEGASRPTHFRGVTTVVAKLFNLVLPEVAVFGQKDCQQASIIQRMAKDLNFPVRVVVAPTRRERDGLAMSSRNAYLTPSQRSQAVCLSQALNLARQLVRASVRPLSAAVLTAKLKRLIDRAPEARVDYIAFFDPRSFQPVKQVSGGTHLALAVFFGKTRLIDNALL
ncbi:MAG: pantoate--beta-alanine ligase [Verrucomicrobiales bacterium]|nr:pantoate--beta-alanine ligase [Verrucomicrobiales bacterium]